MLLLGPLVSISTAVCPSQGCDFLPLLLNLILLPAPISADSKNITWSFLVKFSHFRDLSGNSENNSPVSLEFRLYGAGDRRGEERKHHGS